MRRNRPALFKGRHLEAEVSVFCVRWYLPFGRAFDIALLHRQIIVPPQYKWYFVRPGVRQAITHQVVLDAPGPLIQVTAGFS